VVSREQVPVAAASSDFPVSLALDGIARKLQAPRSQREAMVSYAPLPLCATLLVPIITVARVVVFNAGFSFGNTCVVFTSQDCSPPIGRSVREAEKNLACLALYPYGETQAALSHCVIESPWAIIDFGVTNVEKSEMGVE
jgi:hypothetical protein